MKSIIIAGCIFILSGCGLFDGRQSWPGGDPTDAEAPQTDVESLIAAAITRAVVTEKDIPDYGLLKDKSRIVVSEATSDGRTLTAGALPTTKSVDFLLATPEVIQNTADSDGDFVYIKVGAIEIDGNVGIISISTIWAIGKDSDVMYLSGGGYQLEYRRQRDRWVFEKVLLTWIS